jgi:hypothetical protein
MRVMVAMIGTKVQQESFKTRLERIKSGGENTTRHVYVGPVDEAVGERSRGKKGRSRPAPTLVRPTRPQYANRTFFGELFMIPVALAAGILSLVGARVVSNRILAEQGFYSEQFFGIAGSTIGIVSLVILFTMLFRMALTLKGGVRGRAEFAGLAGMILFENLAISRAPDIFAALYSQEYVSQIIAQMS